MRIAEISRHALSACAVAAMLVGCGGPQAVIGSPGGMPQGDPPGTKSFYYTGAEQDFSVPAGVTHVTITAVGAASEPARAGFVTATIPVKPKETLAVFVGGVAGGTTGGFNGGGSGGIIGSGGGSGTGGGGAAVAKVIITW
jgi:hypothetical protein